MAILMYVNTPVYSQKINKVINEELMPCPVEHYKKWKKSRMYLKGINRVPEYDERQLGENSITVKRVLSLSDSYWIKSNKDNIKDFYEVTPYCNEFFEHGV